MKGIKKIFSEPVEFIAKVLNLPSASPFRSGALPGHLPQVVPPHVMEVALPNQAHEEVGMPRVEHQHQLTFAEQGPAPAIVCRAVLCRPVFRPPTPC